MRTWIALVMVAMSLLASCSASNDGESSDESGASSGDAEESETTAAASAPEVAGDEMAEGAGGGVAGDSDAGGGDAADTLQQVAAQTNREIVYDSTTTIEVDDVDAAIAAAKSVVADAGGQIFGQDTVTEPEPQSVLVFKVPPVGFQPILDELATLGAVRDQNISADDVTAQVVDLRSQIASLEISVERLNQLLSEAGAIDAIASIEGQLLERETRLEQLRGQLRTIEGQVSQATITLTLRPIRPVGPTIEVRQTAYSGSGDEGERCPGREELTVDAGDAVTVCITVRNIGDVAVGDLELRDRRLDLDPEDFTLVDGDLERIEPDQEVSLAASTSVAETLNTQVEASVVALEELDGVAFITSANQSDSIRIVAEGVDVPGFSSALSRSWRALGTVVEFAIYAAGLLLPFIWIVPLVYGLRRLLAHRRTRAEAAREAADAARRQRVPPPGTPRPTAGVGTAPSGEQDPPPAPNER